MNIRLEGKRALVTGGNSGIGEAIALRLADSGAKVAINYVTHPETAQLLVQRIKDQDGEAEAFQADVSDSIAVAECLGASTSCGAGLIFSSTMPALMATAPWDGRQILPHGEK